MHREWKNAGLTVSNRERLSRSEVSCEPSHGMDDQAGSAQWAGERSKPSRWVVSSGVLSARPTEPVDVEGWGCPVLPITRRSRRPTSMVSTSPQPVRASSLIVHSMARPPTHPGSGQSFTVRDSQTSVFPLPMHPYSQENLGAASSSTIARSGQSPQNEANHRPTIAFVKRFAFHAYPPASLPIETRTITKNAGAPQPAPSGSRSGMMKAASGGTAALR